MNDDEIRTMEYEEIGVCRFCGAAIPVPLDKREMFPDEKTEYATLHCKCDKALEYQAEVKAAKERAETLSRAHERIENLFGGGAEEYGFIPVAEKIKTFLNDLCVMLYDREIKDATVNVGGGVKAKIARTAKGKISVQRSQTATFKQEV